MHSLLWLGLVSLCQATSDLTTISPALIETIFGTPDPLSYAPSPVASSENTQSSYAPCTKGSGETGECVNFYQCDSNRVMIKSGSNFFDERFNDDCTMYLENCCLREDVLDPSDPIVPPQQGKSPVAPVAPMAPVTPMAPVAPMRDGCGWRNPDGVGGATKHEDEKVTRVGEFPWVVAVLKIQPLHENEPGGELVYLYAGGGSLIHQQVVLTAAHIVKGNHSIVVRAGEWNTRSSTEPYPHQQSEVLNMAVHRKFNAGNLHYDIALLFLSEPFELAPNVGLVCLPPPRQRVSSGTRCTVSGWGKDKFSSQGHYGVLLKKVEVPVVEHQQCQAALRRTRLGSYFRLDSSFMCAGGEGEDSCDGDGGSPLVCPIEGESNRYTQCGMVAWGIGCGGIDVPAVYVDVAFLRTWIDDQIIFRKLSSEVYTYNSQAPGMTTIKSIDSSALDSQYNNLNPTHKSNNFNNSKNDYPSYNYFDNTHPSYDKPDNHHTSYNNKIPGNVHHSYDYPDNELPSYNNPDSLHTRHNKPDDVPTSYNNKIPGNVHHSYDYTDNERPSYNNPDSLHTRYNNPDDVRTSYYNKIPDNVHHSHDYTDNERPRYNNPDSLHTRYNKPDDVRTSYNNKIPDNVHHSHDYTDNERPRYNNPVSLHTRYNKHDDVTTSYKKPIDTHRSYDY